MSIWTQASEIAANTPEDRNRYADFLRAASIFFVICGHWLIATAFYNTGSGDLTPVMMLDELPWTSWLTWVFQVMPIFFIVGGYSNAISLDGAKKKQLNYASWLTGRLHRLLTPLLALVLFWVVMGVILDFFGASTETIVFASQMALVPTWFLAIYTMIVLLAPLSYAFWQRWGFWSLLAYIILAIAVDLAFFQLDWKLLGWANYFWVWLAMHHLGFAWHDNRLGRPTTLLLISAASLLVLIALIFLGPYPIAMAGSPGEEVSNTLPPKITLIALGIFQFGLLLAIEKPMQKLLGNAKMWTGTVIVNTMIMTVYLWHMTILVALLGLCYLANGFGLTLEPGSAEWWWSRPLWLGALVAMLLPLALSLSPLERVARPKGATSPSNMRLIIGAIMAGAGITMATLLGFDGTPFDSLNDLAPLLLISGALICGVSVKFGKT